MENNQHENFFKKKAVQKKSCQTDILGSAFFKILTIENQTLSICFSVIWIFVKDGSIDKASGSKLTNRSLFMQIVFPCL